MISTKFLFIKSFSFSFYAQSLKFTIIFAPTQMLHSIPPNPEKNSRCLKEKTNKAGVTGDFVRGIGGIQIAAHAILVSGKRMGGNLHVI